MNFNEIIHIVGASFRFALPCFCIWVLIRYGWLIKEKRPISWRRNIKIHLLVAYILCLIGITVYRYGIDWKGLKDWQTRMQQLNMMPLIHIVNLLKQHDFWGVIYNMGGNVMWFLPLGFLIPWIWEEQISLKHIVMIGLFTSISIVVVV